MTVFLILLAFILGFKLGHGKPCPIKNISAKKPNGSVTGMQSFWDYDGSEQNKF